MPIVIECPACGKQLRAPVAPTARRVRCPGCNARVLVPAASDDDPRVAAGAPRTVRSSEDDDRRRARDDEDADRPRRRPTSNKGLIIGLSIGGGVVLIGVVVVIIIIATSGGEDASKQGFFGKGPPEAMPGPNFGGAAGDNANLLKQIGLAYHNYHDSFAKGPASADDLLPFLENRQELIAPLRDGRIVFIYNVRILEMTDGTANTVLAYERETPAQGGLVLLGDASVRRVSAEEFRTMPKARPRGARNQDPGTTTTK